jgi:transposase
MARTGIPWRDLPPELGNWNSVHRQYRRWTTSGPWDVLLQALADGGDDADALQMIDSTIVRATTARLAPKWFLAFDISPSTGSSTLARWLRDQDPPPHPCPWPADQPDADAG